MLFPIGDLAAMFCDKDLKATVHHVEMTVGAALTFVFGENDLSFKLGSSRDAGV